MPDIFLCLHLTLGMYYYDTHFDVENKKIKRLKYSWNRDKQERVELGLVYRKGSQLWNNNNLFESF
jgi:hypothetical protein